MSSSPRVGEDADMLMKKAEKKAMVSLTQWKPDYEGAAALFEQAANVYKNSNRKKQAAVAFEKLSACKEKLGEPWLAGKHLEAAGYALKDAGTGTAEEVAALFRRASVCYTEADRAQTAADALAHGGKAVESLDGSLAVELYLESCSAYEEEGKEVFAMDTYRAAAAAMVRQDKLHEAVTVLLRHAGSCDRVQSYAQLARCYLSAVVAHLSLGEVLLAQEGFYDYAQVEEFERSEEGRAAAELLDCYGQGDEKRLKKVVAGGVFSTLEQPFIKLAKKLPVGDFARQAAALNSSRGGGPSEDAAALAELDDDLT